MNMHERLSVLTPPAVEPVSEAEAMAHLRLGSEEELGLLHGHIRAARQMVEAWTQQALITQSWRLFLDSWEEGAQSVSGMAWWDGTRQGAVNGSMARFIEIPKPPLRTIDLVALLNDADQQTTWAAANYFADAASMPGRLVLRSAASTPIPQRAANGLQISFTCGYGDSAGSVPAPLRQAVLMLTAHLFEHRELLHRAADVAVALVGVRALLAPYRTARL